MNIYYHNLTNDRKVLLSDSYKTAAMQLRLEFKKGNTRGILRSDHLLAPSALKTWDYNSCGLFLHAAQEWYTQFCANIVSPNSLAQLRTKTVSFNITVKGKVTFPHPRGYAVAGGKDLLGFYIDPSEQAYVAGSSQTDDGCPELHIRTVNQEDDYTVICFPKHKGWSFFASSGGKTMSIVLRKD